MDAAAAAIPKMASSECPFSSQFPDLFLAHIGWLQQLSGVSTSEWLSGELVELSHVRLIRVRYVPNYLRLQSLAEPTHREHAIGLMKESLDESI